MKPELELSQATEASPCIVGVSNSTHLPPAHPVVEIWSLQETWSGEEKKLTEAPGAAEGEPEHWVREWKLEMSRAGWTQST